MKKIDKTQSRQINGGCTLSHEDSVITRTWTKTTTSMRLGGKITREYTEYICGKCGKKCTSSKVIKTETIEDFAESIAASNPFSGYSFA